MKKLLSVAAAACLLLGGSVNADCYMQYPPGSNDRLNENSADRNNGNRLFRSENNARGGYCWGPSMEFYTGSVLPVQWTAQHGCNSENVECNFVIQYMCTEADGAAATALRDGTTTQSINENNYQQTDGNGKLQFGMHEPLQYYKDCKARERNKGLFLADQNPNGQSARYTRQEPNANNYAFECNEESNYYPYWHPTPWKDIAVLASSEDLCPYYQAESQNVKAKNYCQLTTTTNTEASVPNNERACADKSGQWITQAAWGIAAPACQLANYSRDNHLGNGVEGETAAYNWTIPAESCATSAAGCSCALRIRYNISTANTDNWGFMDSRFNGAASPVRKNPTEIVEDGELTLALNTNQYGRTFQDRSHSFSIKPRPANIAADTNIYNLGVRGKRGNIVQTFPATEYDYVPTVLAVTQDDYIHFQWTGCDTNPNGNAGEGIEGTDRSNIVQVDTRLGNIPVNSTNMAARGLTPMFDNDELRHHMAFIGQTNCASRATLLAANGNNVNQLNQDPNNCAKLNKVANGYFNAGLVKMNNTGTFSYMSTRNNNFSNRSQKGTLIVNPGTPAEEEKQKNKLTSSQSAGVAVGVIFLVAAVAGIAGFFVYGKKNPHSFAGRTMSKFSTSGSNHGYSASAPGERKAPLLG